MKWFILTVSLLAIFCLTTCDGPLGMGLPIDWEAPVLTLDPEENNYNPLYVRLGTIISGTATDNVGVDRITITDTNTGKVIAPVKRIGNRFIIELNFSEEENGNTYIAQINAYDKMGNCNEGSIAIVTLYIDIRPPILQQVEIKRTNTRIATFTKLADLIELETRDPNGERKEFLYRYQNGWFYINGQISEEETKIQSLSLKFYDTTKPDVLLYTQKIDDGYSLYLPRWTIKEEDLINAGVTILNNPDYKTDYYNNNKRYYYRVVFDMADKAGNDIKEEAGYICLWAESDKPKGVIDPAIGAIVSKGTPLPVDLFDDDSLLKAWVGLLTQDQWGVGGAAGSRPISGTTVIPEGLDDYKLNWLKERLLAGGQVLNWNFDKHNKSEPITELMDKGSGKVDEKTIYIATGKDDADYGDYVLFVVAIDKKLVPSDNNGPEWTNKEVWNGKTKKVQLIDENVPLIVFDTRTSQKTGELPLPAHPCPEENTFPGTLYTIGGSEPKYFDITGYTLRENSSDLNSVTVFRMAWIPYNMPNGADHYINAVQDSLKQGGAGMPDGVQYWEFIKNGAAPNGELIDEGDDPTIETGTYKRQTFTKTFSVMGDPDDLKPDTNNFTYNNKLENESKLFIFYAKDNMSHEVFRQLRILGFKEKPEMQIYDITNRLNTMPAGYPDPTTTANSNISTGGPSADYYTLLNTYNQRSDVISALLGAYNGGTGLDKEAEPFQIYPRGSIVKYWVIAEKTGRIDIETITMKDVTFASNPSEQVIVGSGYQLPGKTFSFAEWYPDVTQRTFLFEAKDKLGNVASIQRTIAVTNAARLEKITTTRQNGTYGAGQTITLTANFSSLIYVDNNSKPRLNIRYQKVDTTDPFNKDKYTYVYDYIECAATPTYASPSLSLSFDFPVPENSIGKLETTFDGLAVGMPNDSKLPLNKNGAVINDYTRKDAAFIPGYSTQSATMPNWITATNTLQASKEIYLDGVAPKITGTAWSGKDAYSPNNYYFKTGETVQVTITSDKAIRATGASTLQYQIRDSGNVLRPSNTTYYNSSANTNTGGTNTGGNTEFFKYLKPGTGNSLVYSLTINAINCPYDGEIVNVSQYTGTGSGKIEDNAENTILVNGFTNLIPSGTRIYIKKAAPAAPTNANVQLGGVNLDAAPQYYNAPVNLTIAASTARGPDNITWEDNTQYTITSAFSDYTAAVPIGTNGTYTLQARYKDRAGNEGVAVSKIIEINKDFPKLVSVNATQASGYYKQGDNLEFNLNFAENVAITNAANVSITLENRAAAASNTADNRIVFTSAANTSYAANKDNTVNNIYTAATGGSPSATNGAYVPIAVNGKLYTAYVVNGAANTRTFRIYPAGTTTGGANTGGASLDLGNITFTVTSLVSTIKFNWNSINGKEMRDGLYISAITLTGLSDKFTNAGPATITGSYTANFTGDPSVTDCKNLAAGLRVDAIAPAIDTSAANKGRTPASATDTVTVTGDKLVKEIKLTFTEPVMRGSGFITIRPRGNYAIPSVMEDAGYYMGYTNNGTNSGTTTTDGEGLPAKFNAAGTNRTYISSFYDIYNNSALNSTDRGYLTVGSSMSNLTLKTRSHQSAGPYQKTTQGLVEGPGYTGNYTGNTASGTTLSGANSPDLAGTFMIPDTATKWVLDYQYSITDNVAAVTNIRATLTKAKWRWQEIDVVATTLSADEKTVTIPLNEPLLKGLQWDVYYQAGTFTDKAGNNAPGSGGFTNNAPNGTNNDYWFTSPGVQQPVVRVNRRSYDGRTAAWDSSTTRTYNNPADTSSNATNPSTNTAWANNTAVTDNNGWGITDFNTVHYRVESESPGAAVTAQYYQGAIADKSAARGAWGTGNVSAANSGNAAINDMAWNADASGAPGTWVLSNIVRRSRSPVVNNTSTAQTYIVKTKNGTNETRLSNPGLRMFKSYNRDLTKTQLGYPTGTATQSLTNSALSNGQGIIRYTATNTTYAPLEASKSYVVGSAALNGATLKGVEGVYRTVIMLAYDTDRGTTNYIAVEGSNVKNGMPSVAGFPVRDAEETGDNRYIKVFYHDSVNGTARRSYYWVSTEIICEWYFLSWGGGSGGGYNGTHQTTGDVNNYMMVGYGDLTYGFNIGRN